MILKVAKIDEVFNEVFNERSRNVSKARLVSMPGAGFRYQIEAETEDRQRVSFPIDSDPAGFLMDGTIYTAIHYFAEAVRVALTGLEATARLMTAGSSGSSSGEWVDDVNINPDRVYGMSNSAVWYGAGPAWKNGGE